MIMLIEKFTGWCSGIHFQDNTIYIESVISTETDKTFCFLIVDPNIDLTAGDMAYRFAHFVDKQIIEENFNELDDLSLAKIIIETITY